MTLGGFQQLIPVLRLRNWDHNLVVEESAYRYAWWKFSGFCKENSISASLETAKRGKRFCCTKIASPNHCGLHNRMQNERFSHLSIVQDTRTTPGHRQPVFLLVGDLGETGWQLIQRFQPEIHQQKKVINTFTENMTVHLWKKKEGKQKDTTMESRVDNTMNRHYVWTLCLDIIIENKNPKIRMHHNSILGPKGTSPVSALPQSTW